jgi:predicted permease
MRLMERVVRLSLRLTPQWFRERHGDDVVATHRARVAAAAALGRMALVRLNVKELIGAIALVLQPRSGMRVAPAAPLPRRESRMTGLMQDVRFAARTMLRNPGWAATAVAVLAIGIGASSAMFSALNAFFFRPLPFAAPERLVMLYETNPEFSWTDAAAAPANMIDWREQLSSFDDVAGFADFSSSISAIIDAQPVALTGAQITGNFFSVLGVRAALGRTPQWEDTWQQERPWVILSDAAWRAYFGGDSSAIGRTFALGATDVEVAGVMPAGFSFPSAETQLWFSFGWQPSAREEVWFRRAHFVRPIARLAAGTSLERANTELQALVQRLQREYPATNSVMGAGVMPARDFLIREVRRPLLILFGAVALLLLLACANVANLTLVRGAERTREIALRHALGASRVRVARQLLTESVVLALAGGVVGIVIGWLGVKGIELLMPLGIDGATSVALDVRVVLFTLAASLTCGILFGLAPALRSTAGRLRDAMTDDGSNSTLGRRGLHGIGALVTAEVALALLLVVGAGLMMRSFLLMRDVHPGFRTERVIGIQVTAPASRYPERDNVLSFQARLLEALEGRPGIERAGMVGQLPLAGISWSSQFQAAGWPPERVGFEIVHRRADAAYFDALDIPLVRGRMFGNSDGPEAPFVVLINETFAREHFPNEDPIGQRIAFDRVATDSSTWYEIVGIVADQHQVSPAQPARAEVFEHRTQDWARSGWIVLRTTTDPLEVIPSVRAALHDIDPLIPISRVRAMREVWSTSMAREEFILTLLMLFGGMALLLAAVGVYAVAAQAARRRTREIGIRMALGAGRSHVLTLMLRQTFAAAAAGVAIGLVLALFASSALRSVLFGVAPHDPPTLAAVVALLSGVAAVACYLPARRALTRDPIRSLKQE